MKRSSDKKWKEGHLYIYTHSQAHVTIRFYHQTTDRIQSALVTVVNRKHCLISYHGISLNNAIVTTVYGRVLEEWWQSASYLYVNYDDTHIVKSCTYSMRARVPEPLQREEVQAGWVWGAGGVQAGSPALHISTAWRFCECMHTWASMFMNTCRASQRVL